MKILISALILDLALFMSSAQALLRPASGWPAYSAIASHGGTIGFHASAHRPELEILPLSGTTISSMAESGTGVENIHDAYCCTPDSNYPVHAPLRSPRQWQVG
jgi:hypothetical protein